MSHCLFQLVNVQPVIAYDVVPRISISIHNGLGPVSIQNLDILPGSGERGNLGHERLLAQ
jgi:hypothetical protein